MSGRGPAPKPFPATSARKQRGLTSVRSRFVHNHVHAGQRAIPVVVRETTEFCLERVLQPALFTQGGPTGRIDSPFDRCIVSLALLSLVGCDRPAFCFRLPTF